MRCNPVSCELIRGCSWAISRASAICRRFESGSYLRTLVFDTISSRVRVDPCCCRACRLGAPDCKWTVSLRERVVVVIPIYEQFCRRWHSSSGHLYSYTRLVRCSSGVIVDGLFLVKVLAVVRLL